MLDIKTRLAMLKRPSLLTRAARFGVDEYRRNVHLRRILQNEALPRHGEALIRLLEIEEEMNTLRCARSGNYAPGKHVEVLIAIAGEARLFNAMSIS